MAKDSKLARLPSVDKLLLDPGCASLLSRFGRQATTNAIRTVLAKFRDRIQAGEDLLPSAMDILGDAEEQLDTSSRGSLVKVLNLTGTVLHTNLGRAALPEEAIDAMIRVARNATNLEFDLASGERGDRDSHVENLLKEVTGAEAATVVNNNAAAVLLTLNTLALNREVPVSRGELVEIGGSFRIPDIMQRAGTILIEIGTTNRTHLRDYERAIAANTALLMKVHTSNYAIQGFTQSVSDEEVAALAHSHELPFVTDLGSGTLVDLTGYGLPREPTVADTIASGADIVTFSGDKLLGGPQAGIIVGRRKFIDAIKSNPMKRALRIDKITMAALFSVLSLYRDPDTLKERLPTLRWLTKTNTEIADVAAKVMPAFTAALDDIATVGVEETHSQIGSGALPLDLLPSRAIAIKPKTTSGADSKLRQIAAAFRGLPVPVIGRVHDGRLLFDLRTLDDPAELLDQLTHLQIE
ncbi:MAG: L-seryl-tRNA(Sec) selenium transferase [Pseudomonadales bacterium]|nr:L-seryl-tRNA(Sec) selenium transferase [Pseudomonadales bacterium]